MKKERIITKRKFDWEMLNPMYLIIATIYNICIGIIIIIGAFIPVINYYLAEVLFQGFSKVKFYDVFTNEVKYKIIKKEVIIKEELEKI